MSPVSHLTWILVTVLFACASGSPSKTNAMKTGPMMPAVLPGDQTLPTNMALPFDALPKDMMTGGTNQPMVMAVPAAIINNNNMGGQVPVQRNMVPGVSMSGQAKYSGTMDSGNNMAGSGMTNSGQVMNQPAGGKTVPNVAGNAVFPPVIGLMNPPMNMNIMQWISSMPANMVLMNIQTACSSLQNFVLDSPVAREIMSNVANMNNMAEIFKKPKQCGFPTLSATLRMFLKTCNMYSSCSRPTYGPPPRQPVSPPVTYTVKQTKPQAMPQPQKTYQPPVTQPPPTMGRKYHVVQTPMAWMMNWLYNHRSPQSRTQAGQQRQSNGTAGTSGVSDD